LTLSNQSMLTEAIAAARAGDRPRARELLSRLLRTDSANAEYWVWLSAVVDTDRERIYCLESALKLDPTNRAALRGLVLLGARKPQRGEIAPVMRVSRRQAAAAAPKARPKRAGPGINWGFVGATLLGILVIVTVGLLARPILSLGDLFRPRGISLAPTLPPVTLPATNTAVSRPPTNTPIPAATRILRTPIPTELAGTPLSFFVAATPTPTPILGVTPRPDFEPWMSAVHAFQAGDYEATLAFLKQVHEISPELPDSYYLEGEALRLSGKPAESIQAYDKAITLAKFPPAYLGRGIALLELRPNAEPLDFDRAIEADPNMVEAYLIKSDYLASRRLWQTMEEMLQVAIDSGVHAPILYLRLSEAQINREHYEQAMASAIEGSASDPTLTEGYLALGRAYTEMDQFSTALWPLQTYVAYRPDDARGWAYLARVYVALHQPAESMQAANLALEINGHSALAFLARGFANLELGYYEAGLQDFQNARRYGQGSYWLDMGFATTYYYTKDYTQALNYVNPAIKDSVLNERRVAFGYVLRALVYESTDPPLLEDAIINWHWVLDLKGSDSESRSLAEAHLLELTGEGPTRTPTQPPATRPVRTSTPGLTPLTTLTGTVSPTPTVTLSPTVTPTPTITRTPYPTDDVRPPV